MIEKHYTNYQKSIYIDTLFGDKGYVGSIDKDLKKERGTKLV